MPRDIQLTGTGAGVVEAPQGRVATSVLLCQELAGLDLDLTELGRWLEKTLEGVRVEVVPDLCHAPRETFPRAATGTRRIVLGLCSGDYAELEMSFHARKAGLDPLGIEAVNLGAFCAMMEDGSLRTEKARLLLAAAIAKVKAYPGSNPDNLKPYFEPLSQKVSRRALFTLPPLYYRVVPSMDDQRCVTRGGCALCVQACPRGALERRGERVWVDKVKCDGCGLCLAACPNGAVRFPGYSPAQLEAQVTALLEADSAVFRGRPILFTCRRSARAIEGAERDGVGTWGRWLPVQVPCVGMVSAGWVLQCVARGATVGVAPCADGCPSGQDGAIRGRIDYCRELLRKLSGSTDQIRLVSPANGPGPEQTPVDIGRAASEGQDGGGPQAPMFGPRALVGAIRMLVERYGTSTSPALEHRHSPVGVVSVDVQRCTGCGVCAEMCPTGALGFRRNDRGVSLTFDAASCVACGQCVAQCPEKDAGAIRVHRMTDLDRLTQGRVTLRRDREARCETCGAPVAPLGMLNRISELLGGEEAALIDRIGRYCLSCRGSR